MSYESGTATDKADLITKLLAFLTRPVASNGCAWNTNRTDAGAQIWELWAPGLADTEEINVVLRGHDDVSGDQYALSFRMSPDWQAAFAWNTQTNISSEYFHPIWNDSMPYWFIGNKQRVIIVTKVSTVYTASYIGRILPYGTPQEYGLPWIILCPRNANTRWSSTSEDFRNFWDPRFGQVFRPGGAWQAVANHYSGTGNSETAYTSENYIWPFSMNVTDTAAKDRYRELRDNVDGTYPLLPLICAGQNPGYEIYGELDGAFAIPAFSAASEDIVTVGGVDHLIVQNVFRTARFHYCAIKLA